MKTPAPESSKLKQMTKNPSKLVRGMMRLACLQCRFTEYPGGGETAGVSKDRVSTPNWRRRVDALVPVGLQKQGGSSFLMPWGYKMTTLGDVADMLKTIRRDCGLSQSELADRAGVARTTVTRMETVARGDMSVMVLVRLLAAAGYDLKVVKRGHGRTLEDILEEQRRGQ